MSEVTLSVDCTRGMYSVRGRGVKFDPKQVLKPVDIQTLRAHTEARLWG